MRSHLIDVSYGEIQGKFQDHRNSAILARGTSIVDTFRYGPDKNYAFNIIFEPQTLNGFTKLSIPEGVEPAADGQVIEYVSARLGRNVKIVGE